MCAEAEFIASYVDLCVISVEDEVDTTVAEAYRNAHNAFTYIFFGDEKALESITEPAFINEEVLGHVVAWAKDNVERTPYVQGHFDVLEARLRTT